MTTVDLREFSSPWEDYPLALTPHSPLSPALGNLSSTFHYLWICLFWTFHTDGNIQYVAFWFGVFHLACFQSLFML